MKPSFFMTLLIVLMIKSTTFASCYSMSPNMACRAGSNSKEVTCETNKYLFTLIGDPYARSFQLRDIDFVMKASPGMTGYGRLLGKDDRLPVMNQGFSEGRFGTPDLYVDYAGTDATCLIVKWNGKVEYFRTREGY